ncbi:TnsA-like heteromeric transposase endonuclease subunit [Kocuria rosea]|uniref:TnsA-like heteromeric transposase endonuclease subunit n=1 Tax=Kocuria rosea TaxID=1275 RepID=A0A4V3B2R7_KOCRO|nr:TnsA-like heteromeric transposase endonuclease subunit [Kocuria rosea]TDL41888.1 TnsA-like heteromeric transposase endonuclease subunit [Kocuria rosea]
MHRLGGEESFDWGPSGVFPQSGKNQARSSHPYQGVRIKDGLEEIRWHYPARMGGEQRHVVVEGSPFTGDLTRAVPIRIGPKYPLRPHHNGSYIVGQTRQEVWHESMTERSALLLIEHTMSIVSIASQPCCFLLRGDVYHYPDYALRTLGGDTVVVDVRDLQFTELQDIARFNRSANLCEAVGLGYTVIEPLPGFHQSNLERLGRYRHHFEAPEAELQARILEAAAEPIGVMDLARRLCPDPEWRYLPAIQHLMFTRVLNYDRTLPLDDDTRVWKA